MKARVPHLVALVLRVTIRGSVMPTSTSARAAAVN